MTDIAYFASVGWWLPAHERHLQDWMTKVNQRCGDRLAYQYDKVKTALSLCPPVRRRAAVDVGAHVGLWSYHLAQAFDTVLAFEPVKTHRECFVRNVTASHVMLSPKALGDRHGTVSIHTSDGSSGDSWVSGTGDIPMSRLDDEIGNAVMVDLIKLDCEGFELYALKGAVNLIARCRPIIVVEQKPGRAKKFGLCEIDAVLWLESLGYKRAKVISGDYFMVPA